MDSTLLDQIRHLCRDRAAYERLKAILVQQERVHQLSWEEQYIKLIARSETQETDPSFDILVREKALAQLAEAMQRSPSLDLVLQVAVQTTQKLLQVDRVAIFRHHSDGLGEFITDAIATGLLSLAEMPSRHSLTRHIIESTQIEDSAQTFNSISNSSLSTHSINLLEQIGIASYAANKIYVGQEFWGTVVAFHGSNYHNWSESDRTSLSLISAQIGIAVTLSNLRQQTQSLAHDLQVLQLEVNNLQPKVNEIVESEISEINETEIIKDEINETEEQTEDLLESPITLSISPVIEIQEIEPEVIEIQEIESISELAPESIIDTVVEYLVDTEIENDFVNSDLVDTKLKNDFVDSDQELSNVEKQIVVSEEVQTIQLIAQPVEEWELDEEPIKLVEQPVEEWELDEEPIKLVEQPVEEWELDQESIEVEKAIATDSTESRLEELLPTSNALDPVIEPQFIETILMLGGNGQKAIEFLINVIDTYLQDAPNLLWEIDRSITTKEKEQTLQSLNTLRSSSDYVGALILSQECRRLQSAVKADNESLIYTCLSLLEVEVERAVEALRIERSRYT
jgi:GAF domain-containing protein/HPt (histidine-containing phosphotransfer) domain-containing protein